MTCLECTVCNELFTHNDFLMDHLKDKHTKEVTFKGYTQGFMEEVRDYILSVYDAHEIVFFNAGDGITFDVSVGVGGKLRIFNLPLVKIKEENVALIEDKYTEVWAFIDKIYLEINSSNDEEENYFLEEINAYYNDSYVSFIIEYKDVQYSFENISMDGDTYKESLKELKEFIETGSVTVKLVDINGSYYVHEDLYSSIGLIEKSLTKDSIVKIAVSK